MIGYITIDTTSSCSQSLPTVFSYWSTSDTGGWVYFNAAIPRGTVGVAAGDRPTSNWVQIRMTGSNVCGVDFDAAYLANGCQGFAGVTILDGGTPSSSAEKIGPKYVGWTYNRGPSGRPGRARIGQTGPSPAPPTSRRPKWRRAGSSEHCPYGFDLFREST